MAILSVAEARAHVDTDLDDASLGRYLDDSESKIVELYGAAATHTETHDGETRSLFLSRPITSITTVVETISDISTTLASDDYRVIGSRELRRLQAGTNGRRRWGDDVAITYVPVSDANQRTRVQVDLVKLAIAYNAVKGQMSFGGGVGVQSLMDYEKERNALLGSLNPTVVL